MFLFSHSLVVYFGFLFHSFYFWLTCFCIWPTPQIYILSLSVSQVNFFQPPPPKKNSQIFIFPLLLSHVSSHPLAAAEAAELVVAVADSASIDRGTRRDLRRRKQKKLNGQKWASGVDESWIVTTKKNFRTLLAYLLRSSSGVWSLNRRGAAVLWWWYWRTGSISCNCLFLPLFLKF